MIFLSRTHVNTFIWLLVDICRWETGKYQSNLNWRWIFCLWFLSEDYFEVRIG